MPFNSFVRLDQIKKDWNIYYSNWNIDANNVIVEYVRSLCTTMRILGFHIPTSNLSTTHRILTINVLLLF